jgi:hypothetical protein
VVLDGFQDLRHGLTNPFHGFIGVAINEVAQRRRIGIS